VERGRRSSYSHASRPFSNWSSKPASDFFDYLEKDGDKIVAEATAWQTPKKKYCFIYIPVVEGEVART
jgi:hypothetical protein